MARAKKTFGKGKLGAGSRFAACVRKMTARGAKDPKALCAYIGRRAYGKKRLQKMAVRGKKSKK